MSEQRKSKDQKKRNKSEALKVPQDLVSEQSVEKNYKVLGKVDIYLRNVCCVCRIVDVEKLFQEFSVFYNIEFWSAPPVSKNHSFSLIGPFLSLTSPLH